MAVVGDYSPTITTSRLAAVDDVISSACNGAPSRAELPLPSSSLHPHTDTVHAPKPLHPHCVGCCGSQCAHESAYSSSDRPHAYTRAQDTQPSHPARRAATARSRHTSHRERGVGTGERTFRGAIWARDHASPSNLAPRLSPAQRASPRVVRALSRRGRGERFRLAYTLTCCAGRPLGSSSQPPLSKWVEWTYVHMPQRFAL